MRVVVTGGAGFVGSNLVDTLVEGGHEIVVLDDFSTGSMHFLEKAAANATADVIEIDLLDDVDRLPALLEGADVVVHLAANADVRHGWEAPRRDIDQNILVTHHVLEAMRAVDVRRIVFSSTGSVYGDASVIPTPEACAFPVQTSLYGASKVSAEGLIQAYTEGTDLSATIFRFVSVLGPRYTHGHVLDFVRKLRSDPTRLEILGDGRQRKSYLHVEDCVRALIHMLDADHKCEVYNLGVDNYCTVDQSAGWICERLGVQPEFVHSGGDRGWIGDNPFIFLDVSKLRETGWSPRYSIQEAIELTVDYLNDNEWILDREDVRK